jgi:hypothetical protein
MATIKATSPCCGDVELKPAQVRLVLCTVQDWSYYAFGCTHCGAEVRKPAGVEVQGLLRTGGVRVEHWVVPAEALETHGGPAISYDDVLDFALRLQALDTPVSALTALRPGLRTAS